MEADPTTFSSRHSLVPSVECVVSNPTANLICRASSQQSFSKSYIESV